MACKLWAGRIGAWLGCAPCARAVTTQSFVGVPPLADWDARLTSTYPDTLAQAANKSALTALGCHDITRPHVPTQVAVPMMCLDDSTGALALLAPLNASPEKAREVGRGLCTLIHYRCIKLGELRARPAALSTLEPAATLSASCRLV